MKKYVRVLAIDMAYVLGISNAGLYEIIHDDGTVEKDDLRLSIDLSAGHSILLMEHQRFYVYARQLIIEDLETFED